MYWSRRRMLKTTGLGLLGAASFGHAETDINFDTITGGRLQDLPTIDESDLAARREKAVRLMTDTGIDALLLTGGSSLLYFSGISWGRSERLFGILLFKNTPPAVICPAFEEQRALEQIGRDYRVFTWHEHESPFELVKTALGDAGISSGRIGIEETVRFFVFDGIRKAAPSLEPVSGDPVTVACRTIKSPKELELMRRANRLTLEVYARILTNLQADMTEDDTSKAIAQEYQKAGVPGGAFALHGPNSAFPHGTRNRLPLTEGMTVLVDGGCRVGGYPSDITRTVVFGEPTKKQREVFAAVRGAQDAALAAAEVGAACGSVDDAARKVITDSGYGPDYKYLTHRVGHGIGLDGHEWPYLVRGNPLPIAPGMTFTNEPGIYIYGEFGLRLEDVMYIDEEGGRLFTLQSPALDQPFAS
jgi:Xaa-Pro dipeptidase